MGGVEEDAEEAGQYEVKWILQWELARANLHCLVR